MKNFNNIIIPIWKPKDIKSNDIVSIIRKKYNVKAGHAGTLDPFAEGVLIVCTGEKTKNVSNIQMNNKKYLAKIKLGERTNTLDIDGEVIQKKKIPILSKQKIKKVLNSFKGKVKQRPPAFSALRKNNVRLYQFARKDIYISLQARDVSIYAIKLLSFDSNYIDIEIECGKGTYIRSLARDIAAKLDTCGFLYQLKRISVGKFNEYDCKEFQFILDESL